MTYTPTEWKNGDIITAEGLNNIENGIVNAGSALIVQAPVASGGYTCDHTVQEIYDAISSGTLVFIAWTYGTFGVDNISHTYFAPVTKIFTYSSSEIYCVCVSIATLVSVNGVTAAHTPAIAMFTATTANEYPVYYKTVYPQTSAATNNVN